ncbi:TPA: hypothetical protein ACQGV3_006367 [Pseudomonas aeruginosa]|uniref:hypothetical protein n=1 Tax=Pseudomonas aeruginosa TaxID=287 RepID=UPI001F4AC120|nr:hypothetical protein [Pseudomonas aeruginosa]HBO3955364.1 hypothetical protein [Pseudomonas aeruginosa]
MSKELNKAPVEQAGGDERDFQAEGAQEVPSPVSQEYDRHLISLLRKGEALPGHQEEAADEIERLRDWNDHLNNTVLPNILNPTFLMLMKGGERLLDLCTKDGEFIGVSLNDMKDVFDWMVTHARIAPDQAALAQPSPAQAEQAEAEAERPEVFGLERYRVERTGQGFWPYCVRAGDGTRELFVGHLKQCKRVAAQLATAFEDGKFVAGALRAELETERMRLAGCGVAALGYFDGCADAYKSASLSDVLRLRADCDAALAEVAGLRSLLNSLLCYVERDIDRMRSDRDKSDNKEIYDRSISLAMERLKAAQNAVFTTEPGCDTAVELAAQTTQAQHSVPEVSGIGRDFAYPRSVVLYLRTEPTDDDLRAIHDGLRSLAAAPGKEGNDD